jgi:hypothetical protein
MAVDLAAVYPSVTPAATHRAANVEAERKSPRVATHRPCVAHSGSRRALPLSRASHEIPEDVVLAGGRVVVVDVGLCEHVEAHDLDRSEIGAAAAKKYLPLSQEPPCCWP